MFLSVIVKLFNDYQLSLRERFFIKNRETKTKVIKTHSQSEGYFFKQPVRTSLSENKRTAYSAGKRQYLAAAGPVITCI